MERSLLGLISLTKGALDSTVLVLFLGISDRVEKGKYSF